MSRPHLQALLLHAALPMKQLLSLQRRDAQSTRAQHSIHLCCSLPGLPLLQGKIANKVHMSPPHCLHLASPCLQ